MPSYPTRSEAEALRQAWLAGDERAGRRLVDVYGRLATYQAHQFWLRNRDMDMEDLRQVALEALTHCLREYRPTPDGPPLPAFISIRCRWLVLAAVEGERTRGKRLGAKHARKVFCHAARAAAAIEARGGDATDEAVAARLRVPVEAVSRMRARMLVPVSIDDPEANLETCLAVDPDTDAAIDAERLRADVKTWLATLPKRERTVISLRYLHGETLARVGERLGVSRERVRQIEVKALDALRDVAPASARRAA